MKRGFTIVEIITVLAIIGIGMGLFYSVFFVNWSSFEKQLTLIDLQMEADNIIEMLSFDAKFARQFTVTNGKQIDFSFCDPTNNTPLTYALTTPGEIQKTQGSTTQVISEYIDYNNSSFTRTGDYLQVDLRLRDDVLGREVELDISTQISPRNLDLSC